MEYFANFIEARNLFISLINLHSVKKEFYQAKNLKRLILGLFY